MRIAVCTSMVFTEEMLKVKKELEENGHTVFVSEFANEYVGKSESEKETLTIYHKNEKDAIRSFYNKIKESDAILVLNYDRRGIRNYIGGNTFLEIGFAHVLGKRIFLLNPIPDIPYYASEIEATRPIVLNGTISRINFF